MQITLQSYTQAVTTALPLLCDRSRAVSGQQEQSTEYGDATCEYSDATCMSLECGNSSCASLAPPMHP